MIVLSVFVRARQVRLVAFSGQLKTKYFSHSQCLMLYICGAFLDLVHELSVCLCVSSPHNKKKQKKHVHSFPHEGAGLCRSAYAGYSAHKLVSFSLVAKTRR